MYCLGSTPSFCRSNFLTFKVLFYQNVFLYYGYFVGEKKGKMQIKEKETILHILILSPTSLGIQITEGRNLSSHDTLKQDNCEFWKSNKIFKVDLLNLCVIYDVSHLSILHLTCNL